MKGREVKKVYLSQENAQSLVLAGFQRARLQRKVGGKEEHSVITVCAKSWQTSGTRNTVIPAESTDSWSKIHVFPCCLPPEGPMFAKLHTWEVICKENMVRRTRNTCIWQSSWSRFWRVGPTYSIYGLVFMFSIGVQKCWVLSKIEKNLQKQILSTSGWL